MAKPKPLNVAMVGSGFMGRTHSNAFLKVAKFFNTPYNPVMHTLVSRGSSGGDFADRWGWQNQTSDVNTVFANDEIDLVDLVTPNNLHAPHAIAAFEAGKHVACEKPLAGTLDDARAMMQAAKKAKKSKSFCWFVYRRVPAVAMAHQFVKEGKLGRIYHVRAKYLQDWGGPDTPLLWRFKGKEAGSGAHGDLNAHIIDMARFITGDEITEVTGAIKETFIKQREIIESGGKNSISAKSGSKSKKKRYGRSTVDDALLFLAKFKQGAVASFESTRLATGDKNANSIEIHGEKGAIKYNFERANELEWYDNTLPGREQGWSTINVTRGDDGHPYVGNWWPAAHIIGYEHTFVNMAADMLNVIGGKKPVVPICDFEDAYQTQRVLEAAVLAADNRCPVKISEVK